MPIPIFNASSLPLNQNTGGVPNVADAMYDYFQPMVFSRVTKDVIDFVIVETKVDVDFRGVWQPFSDRQLTMKPEGQRSWEWFWVHAEVGLQLIPDEVITYLGKQYRVMALKNYSLYGYVEYHLVNDYSGAGPVDAP